MRKKRLIKEQQRNKLLEDSGVSLVAGADLISIDVQSEYENYFGFDAYSFGNMINDSNESLSSLTFLFNGPDMGFSSEEEYRWWLIENCGIDEEITAAAYFYDKGYAFFRYCMDEGIDDDELVDLVKFMMRHNVNDSREIDKNMWTAFMKEYGYNDIHDLLEPAEDMINIPDLMEFLQRYNGKMVICGGGINECLKEVEIALMAINKNYNILTKFTY